MSKQSLAKASARKQQKLLFGSSEKKEAPSCPVCNRVLWLDESFSMIHIDQCLSRPADLGAPSNSEMIDLSYEQDEDDAHAPAAKKRKTIEDSRPSPAVEAPITTDEAATEFVDKIAEPAPSIAEKPVEASPGPGPSISHVIATVQRLVIANNLHIETVPTLPGLFLVHNFITEEEESALVKHLDSDSGTSWHFSSFNGHCQSKVFGVLRGERLVRQNVKDQGEQDIPPFYMEFAERAKALMHVYFPSFPSLPPELFNLQVNDCNANSYLKVKKDYLRPHYDDRALSGPLLLNLSLLGDCYMTYVRPNPNKLEAPQRPYVDMQKVFLSRRTLQIVSQTARWSYMHCISAEDVLSDRRVSLTFRQSGDRKQGIVPTQQKSKEALQAFLRPSA